MNIHTENHKVAIVTGASSGIGEATAKRLLESGYIVYAGARRTEKMLGLESAGAITNQLDVTDPNSIERFVSKVITERRQIDVLINNAGYGSYGAVEDVSPDEARRQFDVNLFGLAAMTNAVLPSMRGRQTGTVIHIGSVGGKLWSIMGGWYQASKYALEGLSDCTRNELRPFGIDVVLIEPGGIRSEWRDQVIKGIKQTSGSGPYKKISEAAVKFFEGVESMEAGPEVVADAVLTACSSKRPKARYVVPGNAKIMLFMKALLSDRMFDKIWGRFMGIPKSL
jgi:NAD(P)-dependent dehydrogenase (short-subunit alcohol dehydrogenase family)